MAEFFSSKRDGETVAYGFDFQKVLATGETISTATFSSELVEGTDPSPGTMISGSATISGTKVTQLITGGVDDAIYRIVCEITTSLSQTIHGTGLLQVQNET